MCMKMYWNSEKNTGGKCHSSLFLGRPQGNVDEYCVPRREHSISGGFAVIVTVVVVVPTQ